MAEDVQITFGAEIDDLLAGVDRVKDAVAGLAAPVTAIAGTFVSFGTTVAASLPTGKVADFAGGLTQLGGAAQTAARALGQTNYFREWRQGWTELLIAHQSFFNQDNAAELAYWQQKLDLVRSSQATLGLSQKEYGALAYELEREVYQLEKRQAQESLQDELATIKAKQEAARGDFETVIALEQQKLAILKQDYGEMSRQYQGELREMAAMERQYQQQSNHQWDELFRNIGSSFERAITGLVTGTTTWQRAFTTTLQSITQSFIQATLHMLSQWVATEAAKTLATETGAAARVASEQAAGGTGLAALVTDALKAIGIDAAKAFAGVFAFLSPLLGPAAAAPAAAAQATVYAAGSDLAHLDVGAWSIPQNMPAYLHAGEMVVPADFASGLRSAGTLTGTGSTGAGTAALNLSFSISALDGASVQRLLMDNRGAVMTTIARAVREGNSAGLSLAR